MDHLITETLKTCQEALNNLLENKKTLSQLSAASDALVACFKQGGRVYSCGNGGSMCDAMHFAEELTGRYRKDRRPLPAVAISDPSHLSCTSNDYGYDYVFSRFVDAFGQENDILVTISTSGNSKNCVLAAQKAKEKGMKVIALTGKENSQLTPFADFEICTLSPTPFADRVQELHIKCIHILIALCEKKLGIAE